MSERATEARYIYTYANYPDACGKFVHVVDPNGRTVATYKGQFALADAQNDAKRRNKRAGLG